MLLNAPQPAVQRPPASTVTDVPELSVIVPFAPHETEGDVLLEQLCALPACCELILVPSGSQPLSWPPSLEKAPIPVREYLTLPGRARQMNAGARVARGRWLWFLHADSRLHLRTLDALHAFLAGDDALGYFDLRFRSDGPRRAWLNAWGANLRSRWLGLPFGDQGFVLPAAWFARLGGYDESASYGEDHLLVWQARAAGLPVRAVGALLSSSARKYAAHGWWRTSWRHVNLTVRQAWPKWQAQRRGTDES